MEKEGKFNSIEEIPIYRTWNFDLEGNPLESDEFRIDKTGLLGQNLSSLQDRIYSEITRSKIKPISTERIYESVYGTTYNPERERTTIQCQIFRIRQRLGEESIITLSGGYISRRALIEATVSGNLSEQSSVSTHFGKIISERKLVREEAKRNAIFIDLTPVEVEILFLVSEGLTSLKDLAVARDSKMQTIKNQLNSIYTKLNIPRDLNLKMILALTASIELGIIRPFEPTTDIEKTQYF